MEQVRRAAVAGSFYPGHAPVLAGEVANLLAIAADAQSGLAPAAKALIAPHAGYVYSGPIAASAYAPLMHLRERIQRVILLGPAHRVSLAGLALPGVGAFATPLGTVHLDTAAAEQLLALPQVVENPRAHALEHSLEVQLPFLQTVLERFALVPLVVGDASAEQVAEVLDAVWGGDETLIVISSDLSHYLSYSDAREIDAHTAHAITGLRDGIDHNQACGATPLNGLLLTARRRGMRAQLLDLRNSGDTAGDHSRVVGYGAFAFV
jgi:MEMO1 family protein